MIILIDDYYFNPLQVTSIWKDKEDCLIYFSSGPDEYIRFKNWTRHNLAARINELIEEFNKK